MKKNYIILLLLGVLFCSCSSDDDINNTGTSKEFATSKDVVNLANIEGSATINIASAASWSATVENGSDWISLSPSSGNGDSPLRIMVTNNTEGDTRTGKIKVSQSINGSTATKDIEVNQLGSNPDILIEYSKDIRPFEGGELIVSVTSNTEWEVFINETYDWITVEDRVKVKAAFVTEECKLIIAPNSNVKRSGNAIIRA